MTSRLILSSLFASIVFLSDSIHPSAGVALAGVSKNVQTHPRNLDTSKAPQVNLTSISARTITAGERVTWNIEISVQPGYIKGVYVQMVDALGQSRQLYMDPIFRYKNYVVNQAETFTTELILQTHSSLAPGRYAIVNMCLEVEKRDCVSDTKYSSIYDPSSKHRQRDLSEFSFTVLEPKGGIREEPLTIKEISPKKNSYSPGEVIRYEIQAKGTMALLNASLSVMIGNSYLSAYCQPNSSFNCSYFVEKESGLTRINFLFPLPEDLPSAKVNLHQVLLSSTSLPVINEVNSTASWNSTFVYEGNSVRLGNNPAPTSIQAFDLSRYQVTILDSGGPLKRTPTWSNLAWSTNKVTAGAEATLRMDLNGYSRNISGIFLSYLVSASGPIVYLKDPRSIRVKPDRTEDLYPLSKTGTYEVTFRVPRSARPGFYRISQLGVEATNCDAKNEREWMSKVTTGTGQCQGLNSWQTVYSNGTLNVESWRGFEETGTLVIEILPATKPKLPNLKLISTEATTLKIGYPFDDEVNCQFKSDSGSLTHLEMRKGHTETGQNNLVITDLKPDSTIKISGSCLGTDGIQGDIETVEFRTTKPIPPAAPKLSTIEVGVDYAKLEFNFREGFRYQAKSSAGEVAIGNGTIQVTKLPPDSRVELQISITDAYAQTTTGDAISLTTKRPNPPVVPKLETFLKSQTRILLRANFDPANQYEFSVSRGTLEVAGNQISISSLQAGEKVNVQVTVKDRYGQSVTGSEVFQSDLPTPPRTPSLRTESTLPNEINLLVSQQVGTQIVVKSDRGQISVIGEKIKISGLSPRTSVTVTVSSVDPFGQSSDAVIRSFTTSASPRQRSITCTNGKSTKVIVGVNPSCPTGYRRK